jgi:hypothetical protein
MDRNVNSHKQDNLTLYDFKWFRLIVDEADNAKNF